MEEDLELAGSNTNPPLGYDSWSSVREEMESHAPSIAKAVGENEFLQDAQHWSGLYAIPNCPSELGTETATVAYKCAVIRYGGKADKVRVTTPLHIKISPFIDAFRSAGGVSLYHWAFVQVKFLSKQSAFKLSWNGNQGVGSVFDKNLLTPRNLSSMFRQFPSRAIVCLRPCDAVITYKRRQQAELTAAMRLILETNQVKTGIAHVQAALPLEELKQQASAWRITAKAVEASLHQRIKAGEDVWQGIFPGLER